MNGINHVRSRLSDWLGDEDLLRARRDRIILVGWQETLDADFRRLVDLLGLPTSTSLPTDEAAAHRSTPDGSREVLSEEPRHDHPRLVCGRLPTHRQPGRPRPDRAPAVNDAKSSINGLHHVALPFPGTPEAIVAARHFYGITGRPRRTPRPAEQLEGVLWFDARRRDRAPPVHRSRDADQRRSPRHPCLRTAGPRFVARSSSRGRRRADRARRGHPWQKALLRVRSVRQRARVRRVRLAAQRPSLRICARKSSSGSVFITFRGSSHARRAWEMPQSRLSNSYL